MNRQAELERSIIPQPLPPSQTLKNYHCTVEHNLRPLGACGARVGREHCSLEGPYIVGMIEYENFITDTHTHTHKISEWPR